MWRFAFVVLGGACRFGFDAQPTNGRDATLDGDQTGDGMSLSDGGTDARVGGVANPTFDVDCAGWVGQNATVTHSSLGRTAPGSCMVCVVNAGLDAVLSDVTDAAPMALAGEVYVLEGWMRAVGPNAASTMQIGGGSFDVTPSCGPWSSSGLAPELDTTWQRVRQITDMGVPCNTSLGVELLSSFTASTDCFLLDDVTLVKQ